MISLKLTQKDEIVLDDDTRYKIINIDKFDANSSSHINNFRMIEGLKHNFLNISQLCEKDYLYLNSFIVICKLFLIKKYFL